MRPTTTSTHSSTSTSTSATPNCSQYISLPASFYIHDSTNFLTANFDAGVNGTSLVKEVSTQAAATVFFAYTTQNSTLAFLDGQAQLGFNHTDTASGKTMTYTAWVKGDGSAIMFYSISVSAKDLYAAQYYPISAANSYQTCNLALGAVLNKYTSIPANCGGTIWLDTNTDLATRSECTALKLTFSPVS